MTADQMKKYAWRIRRRRWGRRGLAAALLLSVLLFLADRNVRPMVFALAQARSAAMASQVLTLALSDALGRYL